MASGDRETELRGGADPARGLMLAGEDPPGRAPATSPWCRLGRRPRRACASGKWDGIAGAPARGLVQTETGLETMHPVP